MPDYGSASYWDERYATMTESYDWYQDYGTLKSFLDPYMRDKQVEILIPGCGSSTLGGELYNAGYQNITNVDISEVVVNQMTDKYGDCTEMEFNAMDARAMELIPDACFDVVIDKGLFDSQLCAEDRMKSLDKLMAEMYRVLKPGGAYLIISHGPPSTRVNHITSRSKFMVEHTGLPRPMHPKMQKKKDDESRKNHFMYACRRR
jgi:ubiquinone/menaquinone biosynthesis C-methylase UbiE